MRPAVGFLAAALVSMLVSTARAEVPYRSCKAGEYRLVQRDIFPSIQKLEREAAHCPSA